MGFSQDFNTELKSIFLNQPLIDSINEVTNGQFGLEFIREEGSKPTPYNFEFKYIDYTHIIQHHNLFTNSHGELKIIKSSDDSTEFSAFLNLYFKTSNEQEKAFTELIDKIDKYAKTTKSDDDKYASERFYTFNINYRLEGLQLARYLKPSNGEYLIWIKYFMNNEK